jgi:LPXTG-motif cell wall-anchored protein
VEKRSNEGLWGSPLAWFGSTFGSTCWLAIAAVVLAIRGHVAVALAVAVCFAIPAAVALRAWMQRDRLGPYAAAEGWFLIAWLTSILATAAIHASDTHADVNLPGDQIWAMWVGLLLGGALLWLAIRRRRRQGDEGLVGGLFDVLASLF